MGRNEAMEEENTTPKKKGSKKGLVVSLSIILVLAIAAAVIIAILIFSGKLNIGKKAKLSAGVDQLTESVTKPINDVYDAIENGDLSIKAFDNFSLDKPFSMTTEVSGSLDTFEYEGMSRQEEKTVAAVKDLLSDGSISFDIEYDGKDELYVKGDSTLNGNTISGEAAYMNDELLVRVKDASEKWIAFPKEEILKEAEIDEDEIEDLKKQFNTIITKSKELSDKLTVDEKTSEEIEERYNKVLKDFINKKEKDIEKEKAKIKVDGKEKSVQKLTLTLKEKDLKDLAKEYVKTFKDDEQLQGIIKNGFKDYTNTLSSMAEELDEEYSLDVTELEDAQEQIDKMFDNADDLLKEIDDLDLGGIEVKLIVYATNTSTARTDVAVKYNEATVTVATTFGENKSTTEISVKAGGMSQKIGTLEIESKDGEGKIKFELDKTAAKLLGTEAAKGELTYKIGKDTEELNLEIDAGDIAKGTMSCKSKVNTNTDTEFNGESSMSIDITSDVLTMKGTLNTKVGVKVGSNSIPEVSDSDKVLFTDEKEGQKYLDDVYTELKKSDNSIRKFFTNSKLETVYSLITDGDSIKEDFEDFVESLKNTKVEEPAVIESQENI